MNKNSLQPQGNAYRIAAIFLCTGLITSSPLLAADRVWTVGTTSSNFNSGSNYSPSGTIAGTDDLNFNSATSENLALTAGLAINSLEIQSGANGFILGALNVLTINSGGITVADNVTATFNNRLASNGAATQLTFTVGSGGTMKVNGSVSPISRAFYKKGAGTLFLDLGMGSNTENYIRTGSSINIEEGTLEIGNSAIFEPGTSFSGANLAVNLGTATTSATLKGGGSFVGVTGKSVTLNTFGTTRSKIQAAGDGSLAIQNLNAASGATFHFDLENDSLILGSGSFIGSTAEGGLALEFEGGAAGVTYTLFNYGTLSGVDLSDFTITSAGYAVSSWNINSGLVQVEFSAVPEPRYAALLLLLAGGYLLKRKRGAATAH